MIEYSLKNCHSLVLFTSESCNLQCSYCEMANHINPQLHAEEAKKVKESLVNGQYLNTLLTTCDKLDIDLNQIKQIELWGQEPTLTLKEFQTFFSQLYPLCQNLEILFFSTNGVGFSDNIINFIKYFDNILTKPCTLRIQFSFDGYTQTTNNRGIAANIIINNILKIINALNSINLKYTRLNFQLHNVVDKESFITFSKIENENLLYQYLLDFENIYNDFILANKNPNLQINRFRPGLQTPLNATSEEGKALFNFLQQCNKVSKNLSFNFAEDILDFITFSKTIYEENEIIKLLEEFNTNNYISNNLIILDKLSKKFGCSYNSVVLKVRYDGTLMHCQNGLYGLYEPVDKNKIDNIIQYRKLQKNFYPNILHDNDDIINNYLYQTFNKINSSFLPAFTQTCQFLTLLLNTNQIDSKYSNINIFIRTAYFLTFFMSCPHTSMMYTGNIYGTNFGNIRLLCNGVMDLIFERYQGDKNNDS